MFRECPDGFLQIRNDWLRLTVLLLARLRRTRATFGGRFDDLFPDIFSGQAGISLKGALAVITKATEGTGYVNPDYAAAKSRAASSGTFFAAYHFLHAGNAAAQAAHAFAVVGAGVPLMVDFEPTKGSNPQLTDAADFIDAYRRAGGVCHLLYLPRWYWQQVGGPSLEPFITRGMALVSSDYTTYSDADNAPGWQPYGGMTPAVWRTRPPCCTTASGVISTRSAAATPASRISPPRRRHETSPRPAGRGLSASRLGSTGPGPRS